MQGAGCRLCCRRAPRDSVAPAFQPTEVFRRAGLRSFSLRGAAAGGLACGSSVGRIRDSFAGTRPSAIELFYRATEDVSSETFFRSGWPTANMPRCGDEAGSLGRRCTLRRRAEAPSRVVCRICDGVWRNRATGFSFRSDMGPSACPSPRLARSGRLRAGMTDGPVRNERTGCWRLGSDGRRPRCGGPGRSDGRSASCGHRAGTVRTPVLPHSSFDPVRRFRRRFCHRYAGGTGHRKGRAGTVAAVPNFWNEIIKTRFFMLYLRNGAFSLGRRRAEAGRAPERENGYLT